MANNDAAVVAVKAAVVAVANVGKAAAPATANAAKENAASRVRSANARIDRAHQAVEQRLHQICTDNRSDAGGESAGRDGSPGGAFRVR